MHPILNKKTVFFDLDGTLVDSAKDIHHSLNLALSKNNLAEVTEQQVRSWIGRGGKVLVEYAVASVTDTQNHPETDKVFNNFIETYQENVCIHTTIYDGVLELLEALKGQGITLVCITNKPEQPALKLLKTLKLYEYFAFVLGGDTLARKKPDPLPLNHALEKLGLQANDAVMVGDSKFDILAGHNANMQSIAITYGYNHGEAVTESNPTVVVDNFKELLL